MKFTILVFTFYIVHFAFISSVLASTLSLSPATGTFNRGCSFNLDVNLDTQGVPTDGTDAVLNFDPARFTMNSIDTIGKVYSEYLGSGIDPEDPNKILVSGIAPFSSPYTGSGKLATINLTVKDTASTGLTQMTFEFDQNNKNNTRDSNVVRNGGNSEETLSAVINGNYTIGTGSCTGGVTTTAPTQAPAVSSPSDSTPSAGGVQQPLVYKTLPDGGTQEVTATFAIIGSILTILGILGLALL